MRSKMERSSDLNIIVSFFFFRRSQLLFKTWLTNWQQLGSPSLPPPLWYKHALTFRLSFIISKHYCQR